MSVDDVMGFYYVCVCVEMGIRSHETKQTHQIMSRPRKRQVVNYLDDLTLPRARRAKKKWYHLTIFTHYELSKKAKNGSWLGSNTRAT